MFWDLAISDSTCHRFSLDSKVNKVRDNLRILVPDTSHLLFQWVMDLDTVQDTSEFFMSGITMF